MEKNISKISKLFRNTLTARNKHPITRYIRCGLSALALQDITPFGPKVVYAGNVKYNCSQDKYYEDKTMKEYNKLVRDNILNIIKTNGQEYNFHIASDLEYWIKLKEKLYEEINEFIKDESIEEIADIFEVLLSILKYKNISISDLENIRQNKENKLGSFNKRIILENVY